LGFIDEFVPLSGLPTCSLATPEDERDWVRTQGRDLVSSGYRSCWETHSVVVHSAVSDPDKSGIDPDGENSIPTFTITPRTSSIDLHTHHYWHSSKPRSTHLATQPYAAQRQGELNTCGLYPPSIRPLLPMATRVSFRVLLSAFSLTLAFVLLVTHNHRSYHSQSVSTMSTSTASTSIAPTITPARYTNNLRTLSQTKPSHLLSRPKVFFTSAKMGAES